MSLFDQLQRTEKRPRGQNEDAFNYLNSSARPMVVAARELLESWFAQFPTNGTPDLRARFRSRDSIQHQGAFFELYCHELLRCSGYQAEVHPILDGVKTNPDFLAERGNLPCFYLEATLAMPPNNLAADRRLAEFQDTLNRVDSPDYFLGMEYRGSPTKNLRGRQLREQLEEWLRSLNFDSIRKQFEDQDFDLVPTYPYEESGLLVIFTPLPKGPATRGRPGIRTIGTTGPMEAGWVHVQEDIKAALDGKAKKYGDLAFPLVVAVNILNDFYDEIDLMNALFGDEQIAVHETPDGEIHEDHVTRKRNGAWFGPKGPRSQSISAILVAKQMLPWTLRSSRIDLFHNPWATKPLALDALPIPQRTVSLHDGKIRQITGTRAADVMVIPSEWPASDA